MMHWVEFLLEHNGVFKIRVAKIHFGAKTVSLPVYKTMTFLGYRITDIDHNMLFVHMEKLHVCNGDEINITLPEKSEVSL